MVTGTLNGRKGPIDNSLEDPGEEFKTHSVGQSVRHHWHNDQPLTYMATVTLCVNGPLMPATASFYQIEHLLSELWGINVPQS